MMQGESVKICGLKGLSFLSCDAVRLEDGGWDWVEPFVSERERCSFMED